jgi:hypothetical protein
MWTFTQQNLFSNPPRGIQREERIVMSEDGRTW